MLMKNKHTVHGLRETIKILNGRDKCGMRKKQKEKRPG